MAASLAAKLLDTHASHLQEVSRHSITKIKKISHLQKFFTIAIQYVQQNELLKLQVNIQISTSPYSCEPSIVTAL